VKRDLATAHAEGRLADRALALMAATLVLLTPPVIGIFDRPVLLLGIPLLHIYCYVVWLAAIGCGAWLSARLNVTKHDGGGDAGPIGRG
jgi:hypothetical protein